MNSWELIADAIQHCLRIRRKSWPKGHYIIFNGEYWVNQDGFFTLPDCSHKDWEKMSERKESPMENVLNRIKEQVK